MNNKLFGLIIIILIIILLIICCTNNNYTENMTTCIPTNTAGAQNSGQPFNISGAGQCTNNSDCCSNCCTGGICLPTNSCPLAATGANCVANSSCQSGCCISGICSAMTPITITGSSGPQTTYVCNPQVNLKIAGIGGSCTTNSNCQSNCCINNLCTAQTQTSLGEQCLTPPNNTTTISSGVISNLSVTNAKGPTTTTTQPTTPLVSTNKGSLYVTNNISNLINNPFKQQTNGLQNLKLKSASISNGNICGIDSNKNIYCGNLATGKYTQVSKPVKLTNISLNGQEAIGTNSANQIWYTNNIFATKPVWNMVPGQNSLKQVSFSADGRICGINKNNEIYCSTFGGTAYNNIQGQNFKNISVSGNNAVGISSVDNNLYFTNNLYNSTGPTWQQLTLSFPNIKPNQVTMNKDTICILGNDKNIYCEKIGSNIWIKYFGPYDSIALDNTT